MRPRQLKFGVTLEQEIERANMLAAWCARHVVNRRKSRDYGPKPGVCPCLLGKRAQSRCACRRTLWTDSLMRHWVDHTETFFRDKRPAIITTEPYDLPDLAVVVPWLEQLGAVAFQHPEAESSYFPGRTHLVAIVQAGNADAYQAIEPNARRWVR